MSIRILNDNEFSTIIAELLHEDVRDKTLSEIDEETNKKLMDIKRMVDAELIEYEDVRIEVSKHLDIEDQSVPGSIAQLLKGCISSSGACPINKDNYISYTYDIESNKLTSLSNNDQVKNNSCAVIYMIGSPEDIDKKLLEELKEKGFEKIKIKHKDITMSNYETYTIEDLNNYLSTEDNMTSIVITLLIAAVIIYIFYKK